MHVSEGFSLNERLAEQKILPLQTQKGKGERRCLFYDRFNHGDGWTSRSHITFVRARMHWSILCTWRVRHTDVHPSNASQPFLKLRCGQWWYCTKLEASLEIKYLCVQSKWRQFVLSFLFSLFFRGLFSLSFHLYMLFVIY